MLADVCTKNVHDAADLFISVIRNEQTDSGKDRFAAKVGKCCNGSLVGRAFSGAVRLSLKVNSRSEVSGTAYQLRVRCDPRLCFSIQTLDALAQAPLLSKAPADPFVRYSP